jgi:hypothetical protein
MSQAKPASSLIEHWFETMRELSSQWGAAPSGQVQSLWVQPLEQAARATLDGAERLVQDGIRTQSEWLELLRNNLRSQPSGPEAVSQWGESVLAVFEQNLELRSRLWDQWFATARQVDFAALQTWLSENGNRSEALATWNEMTRQAMEQHQRWMQSLMSDQAAVAEPVLEVAVEDATAAAVEAMTSKKPVRAGATAARRTA